MLLCDLCIKENVSDFALGYNIYAQTREKLCILPHVSPCSAIDPTTQYGFKGCTGNYSYLYQTSGGLIAATNGPITRLGNATASNATISDCGDVDYPVTLEGAGSSFVNVDWTNGINGTQAGQIPNGTAVATLAVAQASNPLVQVRTDALDISSGRAPQQLTHKGFFTITHNWSLWDAKPYIGFGVEVEGGNRCCDYKQWGIWFKTGASF